MNGGKVGGDGSGKVAGALLGVVEGEVDDAVGLVGRDREGVELGQVTAPDLGSQREDLLRRAVRAGEAEDRVAGCAKLRDDGEAMCPEAPVTKTRM